VLEEAVAASPAGAVGGDVSLPAGVVAEEVSRNYSDYQRRRWRARGSYKRWMRSGRSSRKWRHRWWCQFARMKCSSLQCSVRCGSRHADVIGGSGPRQADLCAGRCGGGESGRCRWRRCIATSRSGGRGGIREITQITSGVGGAHAVAIRGGCGQAGVREVAAPVVVPICANEVQLAPVQRSMR